MVVWPWAMLPMCLAGRADLGSQKVVMDQPGGTPYFPGEPLSNVGREEIGASEPRSQRTFTPTQAVIARSAGLYHYTADGRRLADFTSGVLVANLGHHPRRWLDRFAHYLGWPSPIHQGDYALAPPWTTYNAISTLEIQANQRLLASLQRFPVGQRLTRVLWAASGSEAVQKALWACLARDPRRQHILATRYGFHGKKGLSGAVTGDETSPDRDPRVRFVAFPREESRDVSLRDAPFDPTPYQKEWASLYRELDGAIAAFITEPYLGGGGSYHPPPVFLQAMQSFCQHHDIPLVLDEVQSNFGRTGSMYAFETYGIMPDIVVLGKGMGNGVPVNAAVGRADLFDAMRYGDGSDTWSAHPMGCAATLATLDEFESGDLLRELPHLSQRIETGLVALKRYPIVAAIRGERRGMVWGIELADAYGQSAGTIANACVRQAYVGDADGNAIHLLGPLAGRVIRIAPPLTMTLGEADFWTAVLDRIFGLVDAHFTTLGAPDRVALGVF